MNRKTILTIAITMLLTCGLTFGACFAAFGADNTPGSSDDPLVSKSYVDSAIQAALGSLTSTATTQPGSNPASSAATFEVVHLQQNQKLIGGAGSEIVLRSGEATAIGNGENGVSDMTAGKDLMTAAKVEQNHLLMVPRDDGRGIQVWTESYVMVRGTYTVK